MSLTNFTKAMEAALKAGKKDILEAALRNTEGKDHERAKVCKTLLGSAEKEAVDEAIDEVAEEEASPKRKRKK